MLKSRVIGSAILKKYVFKYFIALELSAEKYILKRLNDDAFFSELLFPFYVISFIYSIKTFKMEDVWNKTILL